MPALEQITTGFLPQAITINGTEEQVAITWTCDSDYESWRASAAPGANGCVNGAFTFTASVPEGYTLTAATPSVTLTFGSGTFDEQQQEEDPEEPTAETTTSRLYIYLEVPSDVTDASATYTITLTESQYTGEYSCTYGSITNGKYIDDSNSSTLTFTNGAASITLSGNRYIYVVGLPIGAKYTITESNVSENLKKYEEHIEYSAIEYSAYDSYSYTEYFAEPTKDDNGTVIGSYQIHSGVDGMYFAYTDENSPTADISLTKEIDEQSDGVVVSESDDTAFTFQLKLWDFNGVVYNGDISLTRGDGTKETLKAGEDNVYTITVSAEETVTLHVPVSVNFTLTEQETAGYTFSGWYDSWSSVSGATFSGTAYRNTTTKVTCYNRKNSTTETGALRIGKQLWDKVKNENTELMSENGETTTPETFKFEVQVYTLESDGTHKPVTGEKTLFTCTPSSDTTTKYTLESGTVTLDSTGKATIEVPAGGAVEIQGLPDGAYYTAKEIEDGSDGYTLGGFIYTTEDDNIFYKMSSEETAIKNGVDDALARGKNYYSKGYTTTQQAAGTIKAGYVSSWVAINVLDGENGTLTLRKQVIGENNGDVYAFRVTLKDEDGNLVTGTPETESVNGGYATYDNITWIYLYAGEELKLRDLPVGGSYTIEEGVYSEDGISYTVIARGNTGEDGAIEEKTLDLTEQNKWYVTGDVTGKIATDSEVTFLNVAAPAIRLSKTVENGDENTEFTFDVTLGSTQALKVIRYDNSTDETTSQNVIFYKDKATQVTVKQGVDLWIAGLDSGTAYTITEQSKDKWKLSDLEAAYFSSDVTKSENGARAAAEKAIVDTDMKTATASGTLYDGVVDVKYTNEYLYTLKYVTNSDETTIPDETYPKDETATFDDDNHTPTRDGYTFTGWYDNPDCTGDPITSVVMSSDKTVYAGWVEQVTLTYVTNGGSPSYDSEDYNKGDTAKFGSKKPTRSGYTFTGWYDNASLTGDPITSVKMDSDKTVYAGWKEVAESYTLHFISNGGTEYEDEVYAPNTNVTITKSPVREGYTFTGWYADKDLKTKITKVTMDSDKSVYAGWKVTGVPSKLNGDDHFAYIIGYPIDYRTGESTTDSSLWPVQPNGEITRAEVATIFFRLLKDDVRDDNLTYTNKYTDVKEGDWFNCAISTMTKLGILNGRSATTFAPNEPITRAEFAAICARFDDANTTGSSNFTDISGHWAKDEIERAATLGWVAGYPDSSFRPNQSILRCEAMTMVNRVLQRIPENTSDLLDDMVKWPDNADTSAWYYLAVQEATNSHDHKKKGEINETWTKITEPRDWSTYEK